MKEPVLKVRTIPSGYNRRVNLTLRAIGGLHYKGFPNQCQSFGCDHETILKYWPELADLAALHLSDIDGKPMHAEANGWYWLAGALPGNAGELYHGGNSEQHFPKPMIDPDKAWATTDYRNPTPDEALEIFARHVRVDMNTARVVRDQVIEVWKQTRANCPAGEQAFLNWDKESGKQARQWFGEWIAAQAPRWKQEALECIAKYGLVVFGDEYESESVEVA